MTTVHRHTIDHPQLILVTGIMTAGKSTCHSWTPPYGSCAVLYQSHPLHVIVLCPTPAVVAGREAGRSKTGYRGMNIADLDRVLREATPRLGLWLDSAKKN